MGYKEFHTNFIGNSVQSGNAGNSKYTLRSRRWYTPDFPKKNDVSLAMTEDEHFNQPQGQYNYEENNYQRSRISVDKHNRCCKGKFWCITDVCGIVCAIFTWLLMFYAEFVVMGVILMPYFGSLY